MQAVGRSAIIIRLIPLLEERARLPSLTASSALQFPSFRPSLPAQHVSASVRRADDGDEGKLLAARDSKSSKQIEFPFPPRNLVRPPARLPLPAVAVAAAAASAAPFPPSPLYSFLRGFILLHTLNVEGGRKRGRAEPTYSNRERAGKREESSFPRKYIPTTRRHYFFLLFFFAQSPRVCVELLVHNLIIGRKPSPFFAAAF